VRAFYLTRSRGSYHVAGMQVSTNEANFLALALAIRPLGVSSKVDTLPVIQN
jgi:hypothetical protein